MTDLVNHPPHYTSHPARCQCGSGIECIQITEHMNFCLGNALKYIWRCGLKGDEVEDLRKARWYIDREIARRESAVPTPGPSNTRVTFPGMTMRRPPRAGEDICGELLTPPGERPGQLCGFVRGHIGPHAGRV